MPARSVTAAVVATTTEERDDEHDDDDHRYQSEDLRPQGRSHWVALGQRGLQALDAAKGYGYETHCLVNPTVCLAEGRFQSVPRLWDETIDAHRRSVHDAIVDTTAQLAMNGGLRSVTMSRIAQETGIGRATLYKYFSDVEAILLSWHRRQIRRHLRQLTEARDRAHGPGQRLRAVLTEFALVCHERSGHDDTELAAALHRDEHVVRAEHHLTEMIRELITDAAEAGEVRADVAPRELASYCVHALRAASTLPSKAATRRLVDVTLMGLCARDD